MQATRHFATLALACIVCLGFSVFSVNPRRPANRTFLLLTTVVGTWLGCMIIALYVTSLGQIGRWITYCSVAGALGPPAFSMMRLSIIYHRELWAKHFWRARFWIGAAGLMAAACASPYFVESVQMLPATPGGDMSPVPQYGWVGNVLFVYLIGSYLLLIGQLVYDQFNARIVGVQRAELQFLLLGYSTVVATVILNVVLTAITHSEELNQYTPLRIVAFAIIIAYGITSRGILNVQSALRLGLSYLLLAIYTGAVCTASWFVLQFVFGYLNIHSAFAVVLFTGVTVAMLVNSASTPLRRITQKILPSADVDFETTVASVAHIVQTVTTFSELLERFSTVLRRAVSAPRVDVFLLESDGLYGAGANDGRRMFMPLDDILFAQIRAGEPDLASEDLHRRPPGALRDALFARMEALAADLIVPIRYHGKLSGLLVLAPRLSGRVYGTTGRATLRLIAEQLGVAVANSRLYTEARQSQAYNQFLVEHLSCGVIATDPAGNLTVVNPEARRVLHLDESITPTEIELPVDMAKLIAPTLEGDTIARNEEIILRPGARDQAHVRVSCLPFASETNTLLGAVLVIYDHTTLEQLQRQVRQADRLASIGTLASGMAHEIKNPLTALKTFTQLLPKRYNDAEFRHDFSGLAGSEIARIERIVNQLLAFARPAPLMIEQVSLHEIIDGAMRLVGPQASRQRVSVRKSLGADHDFIAADKDRLQQVLLNLLLNALQASEPGGWVEIATESEIGDVDHEPVVRLDVRDNGSGISQDLLPHIFDPFFTTKSEGTGLGLSVSYNIVAEHKGRLEAQSEPGKGTVFSMYLPVCA